MLKAALMLHPRRGLYTLSTILALVSAIAGTLLPQTGHVLVVVVVYVSASSIEMGTFD